MKKMTQTITGNRIGDEGEKMVRDAWGHHNGTLKM